MIVRLGAVFGLAAAAVICGGLLALATSFYPEINVERPVSTPIADGGTDAQGNQDVDVQVTLTYTVRNTGTAALNVTNITSAAASDVTVDGISPTSFNVDISSTSTFQVKYTPTAVGAFSFELDITNNDTDEGNYDIMVSGTGTPTLTVNVVGGFGTDRVTSVPGTIDCPGTCSNTFPYNTVVTLNVTVDAGSSFQGWSGDCAAFGAALSGAITMDDCKACTATFVAQPEIRVQRPAGTTILDGATDNLGNQAPSTVHLTYTIDNSAGGAQLSVTGVTASNLVNASGFSVVTGLPLNAAAGAMATLNVSFNVDALGAFSLDVDIDNNDPDENPYDIQTAGTGAAVNEIDVRGNDTSIFDGDTTPSAADHTDFGSADEKGATITRTFTIRNTGLADLTLTGGPPRVTISGAHAGDFTLSSDATTPIAAGTETAFTITFDPSAVGLRQATISIDNNDGDENPFDFSIQGTRSARGDVNGDGKIDVIDVRMCLQIARGFLAGTPAQRTAADVDRDGDVDETDAQILAEFIIGIRQTLP